MSRGRPRSFTNESLATLIQSGLTQEEIAAQLGVTQAAVSYRLKGLRAAQEFATHPARQHLTVEDGIVLVGSDAHIWPEDPSTAQRAFLYFAAEMSPAAVVLNGDLFDGAKISRFPSIGWEKKPTIAQEIAACQEFMGELEELAGEAEKVWTLGNHDLRFETRLASAVPEYEHLDGFHLKDHFPAWLPCWSLWVNAGEGRSPLVIKHRFKGGENATKNNTLHAGMHIATGHLHSLRVTPHTDYWGTRYGVDTGTLARPYSEQFVHYTEDNPVNWRSGFVVFTFRGGRLLMPELVQVWDEEAGEVQFRGEVIAV